MSRGERPAQVDIRADLHEAVKELVGHGRMKETFVAALDAYLDRKEREYRISGAVENGVQSAGEERIS